MTTEALTDPLLARPDKPRARGWIHFWSFVASVATGASLIALAASTVSARAALATAVYSATVSALFGTSALYHRRSWVSRRAEYWVNKLDHSMIFVFIAGTYTPFAVLAMSATSGTIVLLIVWSGAIAGVLVKLFLPRAPRWVTVALYLALGWVAVFMLAEILSVAGVAPMVLLCAGGALYTIGAVVYGLRRPNPWPQTFGFHEVFHSATVLAAICHYVAVWLAMYGAAQL